MLQKYEDGNKKQRHAVNEIMEVNGYKKFTEWDLGHEEVAKAFYPTFNDGGELHDWHNNSMFS